MGIQKLKTLTNDSKQYVGKFKSIIIDGSNLLIRLLSRSAKAMRNRYTYANWNSPSINLLRQLHYIINNTVDDVNTFINNTKTMYGSDDVDIYVIFDPVADPEYYLPNRNPIQLKKLEREKRKKAQDRTAKINQKKAENDLVFNNSKEINKIFDQLDYFNNTRNVNGLMPIIISKTFSEDVIYIYSKVEADLTMKNMCSMINTEPVLVMSADSDFLVLLSDLINVYNTDSTLYAPIHYPYRIWKDNFSEDVEYDKIIRLATISGNDYTCKKTILSFNMSKVKHLLNIDGTFHEIIKSSVKIIKPLITFSPTTSTTTEQLDSIITNTNNELFRNSVEIYEHWNLNFDFSIMSPSDVDNNLITKYLNNLKLDIVDWSTNDVETLLESVSGGNFELLSIIDDRIGYYNLLDKENCMSDEEILV